VAPKQDQEAPTATITTHDKAQCSSVQLMLPASLQQMAATKVDTHTIPGEYLQSICSTKHSFSLGPRLRHKTL